MNGQTYTLHFDSPDCTKANIDLVGGKNASLGELMEVGEDVQVPPGFAVTTDFYEAFLEEESLGEYIGERLSTVDMDDDNAVAAASEDIREHVESAEFPDFLADELESSWERLQAETDTDELQVAVRSSATAEDLPDASFAGQQDTYLNVTDFETVAQRTKECMASLFTARAITYREENGFDRDEVLISVGIQKMVEARTSGVMFTLNPSNGDQSKVRIEANWGLGEAVVSGAVTPDSFLVDKPVYKIVDRNVQEKNVMTVPTDAGTEEVEVDDDKRDVPAITADEIVKLTDLAKAIEQYYDEPQDIEWAIEEEGDDKRFYILQSRPETTWNEDDETTTTTTSSSSTAERILDRL
ncbi:PEP/pyruvate-binding domain-containing protein [Halobellus limi]|jgi:pyruvate,water dikinase|uniref:Probable phosphoenolpyruvate synthase n=1 Tax=Halobellus limi TaxID=699433 RepID=A0A1H6CQA1_9EURY|nr:PEP/pyruvate-binding domain-containing protein [Halobellus limi]QCC48693.1 phosphoenolpyruvate synthase [Halobellus limi]SEG74626.1 pyruvate, water dikinase [Halobellus limi]